MNEQSCAPQEDPVPPQWKTRWYHTRERFLRFLSRILRMPPTLEVEKALRDQHFRVFEEVKKRYLGHCPLPRSCNSHSVTRRSPYASYSTPWVAPRRRHIVPSRGSSKRKDESMRLLT